MDKILQAQLNEYWEGFMHIAPERWPNACPKNTKENQPLPERVGYHYLRGLIDCRSSFSYNKEHKKVQLRINLPRIEAYRIGLQHNFKVHEYKGSHRIEMNRKDAFRSLMWHLYTKAKIFYIPKLASFNEAMKHFNYNEVPLPPGGWDDEDWPRR